MAVIRVCPSCGKRVPVSGMACLWCGEHTKLLSPGKLLLSLFALAFGCALAGWTALLNRSRAITARDPS
jgi:hypothetical protein